MVVDYNDERFKQVETDKTNALNDMNNTYSSMTSNSDAFYQQQVEASKEYATKQSEIQQANTDFAINKIEQQKDQSQKDYTKEQKGAYTDYQNQINNYGVNAEQLASSGLNNSGYSETSKVSMFNAYQNRYSVARESMNKAILNYDNNIKEAQLSNNSLLAEISYNALKTQLELSLEGFQYKNSLLQNQMSAKQDIENMYQNRWQSVLGQINTENEFAQKLREFEESVRQANAQLDFQKQQASQEQSNWLKTFNAQYGSDSGITLTDGSGSKYGYFSNGYQPKGIDGHGLLKSTGQSVNVINVDGKLASQNVWKAEDGTQWYWDGKTKAYKKYINTGVVGAVAVVR